MLVYLVRAVFLVQPLLRRLWELGTRWMGQSCPPGTTIASQPAALPRLVGGSEQGFAPWASILAWSGGHNPPLRVCSPPPLPGGQGRDEGVALSLSSGKSNIFFLSSPEHGKFLTVFSTPARWEAYSSLQPPDVSQPGSSNGAAGHWAQTDDAGFISSAKPNQAEIIGIVHENPKSKRQNFPPRYIHTSRCFSLWSKKWDEASPFLWRRAGPAVLQPGFSPVMRSSGTAPCPSNRFLK